MSEIRTVGEAELDKLVSERYGFWMNQCKTQEKEIERLKEVLKYVAEFSNDPGVVREARAALERRDEGEGRL